MNNVNFKYEVAFAFLEKDEFLANQINDLIKDKLKTFLYSKKQEDISNTDSEKTILDVLRKQSRSVVVLFSNKWGTTPWTRIEEEAIRNRASKEGYNFLLFIPLDTPTTTLKYLPKTQIWAGLAQQGIKGAANVIEELVRSLGGESKEKSSTNIVIKIKTEPQFETERTKFLESVNGFEIAALELKKLFSALESLTNKIIESDKNSLLRYQEENKKCIIHYGEFSIRFYLQPAKNNPLMDSYLYFELQKQGSSSNDPQILAIEEYHFEIKKVGVYGWIKDVDSDSFISSKKLAEESIKLLLAQADNERE